ncbi:anion exchange protein 4 [Drosophila ananassae]|uniref:anion exchange protein 4 n=1 Tax=Drosophila ananassae TaxID=7217 RepID=UPI000177EEB6|nr:anion exchange protein 4 [Drosophila ananassae]
MSGFHQIELEKSSRDITSFSTSNGSYRFTLLPFGLKIAPNSFLLLTRVHLFTVIQLACLIILWLIKSFSQSLILFPLMLVVMIGIRKALDLGFTRRELKILDDIMPEMTKRAAADDLHKLDAEVGLLARMFPFGKGRRGRVVNKPPGPGGDTGSAVGLGLNKCTTSNANEKEFEA